MLWTPNRHLSYHFNAQKDTGVPFHWNLNYILRRDHQKNFLWASHLWVGRRKVPILGYVPKNDEKKNLVHKGLKERHVKCTNIYIVKNFIFVSKFDFNSNLTSKLLIFLKKNDSLYSTKKLLLLLNDVS